MIVLRGNHAHMKILIGSITSIAKSYCQQRWAANLLSLVSSARASGVRADHLILDNSRSRLNSDKMKSLGVNCLWRWYARFDLPFVLADCCQQLRGAALSGGYTHLALVESDQFPAPGTIELMASFRLPFVSIPYLHLYGPDTRLLQFHVWDVGGVIMEAWDTPLGGFMFFDGQLKPASNTGLGCCLISKEVLLKVPFRVARPGEAGYLPGQFHDGYFHRDLRELGFDAWCYAGALSRHENKPWGTA